MRLVPATRSACRFVFFAFFAAILSGFFVSSVSLWLRISGLLRFTLRRRLSFVAMATNYVAGGAMSLGGWMLSFMRTWFLRIHVFLPSQSVSSWTQLPWMLRTRNV